MNKSAVYVLSLWLVAGFASMAGAAGDDSILEMKALKARMDNLPDSTLKEGQKVYKETVNKADDEEIVETPAVEPAVENSWYEDYRTAEPAETADQEESYTKKDMNKGADDEWGNTDVPQKDDEADVMNNEDTSEKVEKTSEKMEEHKSTIMDIINAKDAPAMEEDQAVPETEDVKTMPDMKQHDTVEFRKDTSEEISDGIVEINKRIEKMDGLLDQQINELQSDLKDANEPEQLDQNPPSEGEY